MNLRGEPRSVISQAIPQEYESVSGNRYKEEWDIVQV